MTLKFPAKVLIPTSRSFSKIEHMLLSLINGSSPPTQIEVIIVENGGKKDIEEKVSSLSHPSFTFTYLYSPESGKSNALNFAIKSLIHENTLLIMPDDDVIFNSNWINNILSFTADYGPGHFFGGSMNVKYEVQPNNYIKSLLPRSAIGVSDNFYAKNPKYLFFGCNWAVFSDDIALAGFFDSRFGPGSTTGATGQETDMQNRLIAQGTKKVLIPNNYVTHFVSQDCITLTWVKHRVKRDTFSRVIRAQNFPKLVLFFILFTPIFPFIPIAELIFLSIKAPKLYKKSIYSKYLYGAIFKHFFLKKTLNS